MTAHGYTITKEFHFAASHTLHELPADHKCSNMHGHNYIVKIVLQAPALDHRGFVVDYGELSPIKKWIDDELDHAHLAATESEAEIVYSAMKSLRGKDFEQRTHVIGANTSAENLARYIYRRWKDDFPALREVWVSETPKTWAVYRDLVIRQNSYLDFALVNETAVILSEETHGDKSG